MSAQPDLQTYVREHLSQVPGWSGSGASMLMLEPLAGIQDDSCHQLGSFEIGVHHGRYLIALHNTCQRGSRSLGLDLFDDQSRNIDGSGSGDLEQARSNLRRFARQPKLVDLRSADSLALTDTEVQKIQRSYGGFRFASIDGGHTPIHVANDTTLAARLVAPAGFLIVDDFFNPNFPGVTEGLYRLLESHNLPFVPMIVTLKKLFLCVSFAPRYRAAIASDSVRSELATMKAVEIAGNPCLSVAA